MVMSGETSYAIQYCEFGFDDWVVFRDESVQYLDSNMFLGHYLVLPIYVGPEITENILKRN